MNRVKAVHWLWRAWFSLPSSDMLVLTSNSGKSVQVRRVKADDSALLSGLYYRLSPETQELRFFCHNRLEAIVEAQAQLLAEADPKLHLALVALVDEVDAQGEVSEMAVGVARYACDAEEPTTAEFAIVLRDDFQKDGLGRKLLHLLIEEARNNGVKTLRVVWRGHNRAVQALIQGTKLASSTRVDGGEMTTLLAL